MQRFCWLLLPYCKCIFYLQLPRSLFNVWGGKWVCCFNSWLKAHLKDRCYFHVISLTFCRSDWGNFVNGWGRTTFCSGRRQGWWLDQSAEELGGRRLRPYIIYQSFSGQQRQRWNHLLMIYIQYEQIFKGKHSLTLCHSQNLVFKF